MTKPTETTSRQPIAIIGLGGCFPDAPDIPTFWSNICAGHVAIREVPDHRWESELWYSADHSVADKTYSKIGGFIDSFPFDRKRFRIPPNTLSAIDDVQKMALTAVAEALADAGLEVMPARSGQATVGRVFDRDRTAVILGNAMGGENEDLTSLRVWYPRAQEALKQSAAFQLLDHEQQALMLNEMEMHFKNRLPEVTEDSMPGELSNCITGRVANLFDLRGPNFTTDAACAASMAAIATAVRGLMAGDYDLALAGGVDRSMDPPTYVKFAKIGALSGERSAPFDAQANGFVMGEGGGILVLKRLDEARRDNDKVYAVIRGIGAASDGRGKGITAPNPRGQRLAVERAYADAGFNISSVGLFEAHGTSTIVGDATELSVLTDLLKEADATPHHVALGSVKSMIGHLKSAAGSASVIKAALSIYHRTIPPSAGFSAPATDSPLHQGFLKVAQRRSDWTDSGPRRVGVSAFGFGGTNFHLVLSNEDDTSAERQFVPPSSMVAASHTVVASMAVLEPPKESAAHVEARTLNMQDLLDELITLFAEETGYEKNELEPDFELEADLGIDTVKQAEIFSIIRERYAMKPDPDFKLSNTPTLRSVVLYVQGQSASSAPVGGTLTPASPANPVGHTPSPLSPSSDFNGPVLLCFGGTTREALFTEAKARVGAVQNLNSLHEDRVDLSAYAWRLAFVAHDLADAEKKLSDAETGKTRRLLARGIFLSDGPVVAQEGSLAFLFPGQGSQYIGMLKDLAERYPVVRDTFSEADEILRPLLGANISEIVWPDLPAEADAEAKARADLRLRQTEHCQPAMLTADIAMLRLLRQFGLTPQSVAGHSLGEYGACVAASVLSFADALYAVSARGREMAHVKVEDNGKMATVAAGAQRVEEVLADISGYVIAANKNCHAQTVIGGASDAVDAAVARFTALNIESRHIPVSHAFHSQIVAPAKEPLRRVLSGLAIGVPQVELLSNVTAAPYPHTKTDIVDVMARQIESSVEFIRQVERLHDDGARVFVEVGPRRAITGFVRNVLADRPHVAVATNHHKKPALDMLLEALAALAANGIAFDQSGADAVSEVSLKLASDRVVSDRNATDIAGENRGHDTHETVVISGVSAILPSDTPLLPISDDAFGSLLRGENFIHPIEDKHRRAILAKNVTRLNKSSGEFEPLRELADVVQLAARMADFDLAEVYGLDAGLVDALDATSRLAIAAGIEALRDAGLPLEHRYRTTRSGKKLADRWALPEAIGKRTGVILASAFPALDRVIEDVSAHVASAFAERRLGDLDEFYAGLSALIDAPEQRAQLEALVDTHRQGLQSEASVYRFNRKFVFRILSMGHAQLAQIIVAQGPNTQVNAACASGPQAVSLAQDWIRLGRCDRVVVVTADNVTLDTTLPYISAGFLAAGAAAVGANVSDVAVPFGKKRDGMLVGAGASAFIVERDSDVLDRGMTPIVEILHGTFENSAFHGTRLDVEHIAGVFGRFTDHLGELLGRTRAEIARTALFVSHETYTPARGGSSAAEVEAIRRTFGTAANQLVIANTKGYTGHPMGATIEDVVALKGLQRGIVPAIANMGEGHCGIDPDFSDLAFADGSPLAEGVDVAIRFAAGFGSQMALIAYKRRARSEERLHDVARYRTWLHGISGAGAAHGTHGPMLEVSCRTLRIAEVGGMDVTALGIPSLRLETNVPGAANALLQEIIALFAAQTGYEPDEFEPDYDLEADLGIDTVKQAEIFSLLRERYNMPVDDEFKLSSVATLRSVAAYVERTASTLKGGATTPPVGVVAVLESEPASSSGPAATPTTVDTSSPTQTSAPLIGADTDLFNAVQKIFAEETGYELDELAPDDELEADLGIDTVKQAEIFSRLREHYQLPRNDDFSLSALGTLRKAVAYVGDELRKMQSSEPASDTPVASRTSKALARNPALDAAAVTSVTENIDGKGILNILTELFAAETGYDVDELDPDDELEADLGIDTVKQAEVISLVRERYHLPRDDEFKLTDVPTLRAVSIYVAKSLGETSVAASVSGNSTESTEREAQTPHTVPDFRPRAVMLTPLDPVPVPELKYYAGSSLGVLLVSPEDVDESSLASMLQVVLEAHGATVHNVHEDNWIALPKVDAWIVVGGDTHVVMKFVKVVAGQGLQAPTLLLDSGGRAPFAGHAGARVALAKSLTKEWAGHVSITIELEPSDAPRDDVMKALQQWALARDTGECHEVLLREGEAWTLTLGDPLSITTTPLADNAVVVATGGGTGVTYRLLRVLADRQQAAGRHVQLIILSRTPPCRVSECPLTDDLDANKVMARKALTEEGTKVTPHAVRRYIELWQRRVRIGENLEALRERGASVEFIAADVADTKALRRVLSSIVATQRVDCVIHGAGLEDSKFLVDKELSIIEATLDTKCYAAQVMYDVLQPRRFLNMGSVAGRFGNAAQVDYAAANGALAGFSRSWPNTLTIDWTAWAEVGMATRGSVSRVLEQAGVEFLPADLGAQIGVDLLLSETTGEVMVAAALGSFAPSKKSVPGETTVESGSTENIDKSGLFGFTSEERLESSTLYNFLLSYETVPGMNHHRIGGVGVLPGVIGMELMAQAAQRHLGVRPMGMHDVELASPIKLFRDEPMELQIQAFDDGRVSLASLFRTKHGRVRRREHFSARVTTENAPEKEGRLPFALEMPRDPKISRTAIYQRYFHGPDFQVVGRVALLGEDGIAVHPMEPTPRHAWIAGLTPENTLTAPVLREAGFQAAGLWEMTELGCMALPSGIRSVRLCGAGSWGAAVTIDVRRRRATGRHSEFDVWVRDASGKVLDVMRGYRTALLRDLDPAERFEPAPPSHPAPDLIRVDVAEVMAMLEEDPQDTAERFLSPEEQQVFSGLKHPKRRSEWLAGRIAAKRLIREARFSAEGAIVSYAAISIIADELGAPMVAVVGEPGLSPVISISHSGGLAVAMGLASPTLPVASLVDKKVEAIGVDIEVIEPRSARFIEDYFTADEVTAIQDTPAGCGVDFEVTARWALKEALLKALGIGARVDMRALRTLYVRAGHLPPHGGQPLALPSWFVWQPDVCDSESVVANISRIEHSGKSLVAVRVHRLHNCDALVSEEGGVRKEVSC